MGWSAVATTLIADRGDALGRYAYLLCGDPDDAADLVQDALVNTFARPRPGWSVSRAEAYVRRAILNAVIDRSRRGTAWRKVRHLTAVPVERESPAAEVDTRIDVMARLRALSPRQRACVVLRYYDDLTVDQIAAQLGISSGAVKRYLSDGLTALALALGEAGRPNPRIDMLGRTGGTP